MKKLLKLGCLGLLGIIVLIGVVAALGGRGGTTTSNPNEKPTSAPAAQANASASEPTVASTPMPAVGQDMRVGDVRWKVLSAENMGDTLKSDDQFTKDLKTKGFFVKVQFEIENLSKDMLSYGGADLIDDKDRTFKNSPDAIVFIPEEERSLVLSNLNPNLAKTITEIYEVPAGATGLRFIAGDLDMLGSEEMMIDLGLK
jgi:hypothetical protein